MFDLSSNNAIGERYTIQHRFLGKPIQEVYSDMNTQQRISFARELGSALAEMSKHSTPFPGTLDPYTASPSRDELRILRLQCPPRNAFHPASTEENIPSTAQTVFEFLKTQFARQREYDLSCNREYLNPWSKLWPIIQAMNTMGLFTDNSYYLTHMDFEPRNILIHITSPQTAKLSAIMDWDEAVLRQPS